MSGPYDEFLSSAVSDSVNARPAQTWFDFESRVERQFNEWMQTKDGQRVEREVTARAKALRARGITHYGMKALFESIRYDWTVGLLGDGEYRLNNNHTSLLARRVMDNNPDLWEFFEVRRLRGRI